MSKFRITVLTLIILTQAIVTTGCWNYREVDQLSIVAGVALDKGINEKYQMTVEIIQAAPGKDTKIESRTITLEGKTVFDAARNIISLSGKKLYWSHAKVIILSKEIASEGVTKAIEWYTRDAETREDVNILISEGTSAKEILVGHGDSKDIQSFILAEIVKNQESLSKAPIMDILKFDIESKTEGTSTVIPVVKLIEVNGEKTLQIMGTAIIKDDQLVGFLNGEETKDLIFIRNEVVGGLLIVEMQENDELISVSLEIFKNKTKITPVIEEDDIKIKLNIDTTVSIAEINGTENYIDEEGRMKLEQITQELLKERIEALISKIQSEYDADIFGFGAKLREDDVQVWNNVSDYWEEVFSYMEVNVKTNVHIKSSGIISKYME